MKKTFPLEVPGHKPARVVEQIHGDVRKYLKRERRKTLPEGVDYWDFDCKAGPDRDQAEPLHVEELSAAINRASQENWSAIYLEILAKPGYRTRKPVEPTGESAAAPEGDPGSEPPGS